MRVLVVVDLDVLCVDLYLELVLGCTGGGKVEFVQKFLLALGLETWLGSPQLLSFEFEHFLLAEGEFVVAVIMLVAVGAVLEESFVMLWAFLHFRLP